MDQGNWLFVHFIGKHPEEIQATQMISQKLTEVAGEAHSTHFENKVPKPYQEFRDTNESFDELQTRRSGTTPLNLFPMLRCSALSSTPWPWLSRDNWTTSLNRTSKADAYAPHHQWPPQSSSSRRRMCVKKYSLKGPNPTQKRG